MASNVYDEARFKAQLSSALTVVETVLENTRKPQVPAEVSHSYTDKFLLAEYLTSTALAAHLLTLEHLGVTASDWATLKEWAKTSAVSLRLRAEEKCVFDGKRKKKADTSVSYVSEFSGLGIKTGLSHKLRDKATEYLWKVDVEYELMAFLGSDPDHGKITLKSRNTSFTYATLSSTAPQAKVTIPTPLDLNITWLLDFLNEKDRISFTISRSKRSCKTPRRNSEVDAAMKFFGNFCDWADKVDSYFTSHLFPMQVNHSLDVNAINTVGVFIPVLALFEEQESVSEPKGHTSSPRRNECTTPSGVIVTLSSEASRSSPLLTGSDLNLFLAEMARSVTEKLAGLKKVFPTDKGIVSLPEATLITVLLVAKQVAQHYFDGMDYIEDMLRQQLVAAIGKELTPLDFYNYMLFHYRTKLFKEEYLPTPFAYAIRFGDHFPEGTVEISSVPSDGSIATPIQTVVRSEKATKLMKFSLSAATEVSFLGDRYVHSYISHQFSGQTGTELKLTARARQFSSYVVLLGRLASSDVFDPKYAVIVRNKDSLNIPLSLEQIPSPKEFKDAIASLSPEQQRFCQAYRNMQLSTTIFTICVLQIKPQLEKVLSLPPECLTKEIELTEDLMGLFLEYQIPADLLCYNPNREHLLSGTPHSSTTTIVACGDDEEARTARKITMVRDNVAAIRAMIKEATEEQIENQNLQYQYDHPLSSSTSEEAEGDNYGRNMSATTTAPISTFCSPGGAGGVALHSLGSGRARQDPPPPSVLGGGAAFSAAIPPPSPQAYFAKSGSKAPPTPNPASPTPNQTAAPVVTMTLTTPTTPAAPTPTPSIPKKIENLALDKLSASTTQEDYTAIPNLLEKKYEELDQDHTLRPTIINIGESWKRNFQRGLLGKPTDETLLIEQQESERNKAFDLIDALTRSGALCFDHASLHIIIAATHNFDKTLTNTVIQDNVNPIEKVERSSLIMATTIHNKPASEIVKEEFHERVAASSPVFFPASPRGLNDKKGSKRAKGKSKPSKSSAATTTTRRSEMVETKVRII